MLVEVAAAEAERSRQPRPFSFLRGNDFAVTLMTNSLQGLNSCNISLDVNKFFTGALGGRMP